MVVGDTQKEVSILGGANPEKPDEIGRVWRSLKAMELTTVTPDKWTVSREAEDFPGVYNVVPLNQSVGETIEINVNAGVFKTGIAQLTIKREVSGKGLTPSVYLASEIGGYKDYPRQWSTVNLWQVNGLPGAHLYFDENGKLFALDAMLETKTADGNFDWREEQTYMHHDNRPIIYDENTARQGSEAVNALWRQIAKAMGISDTADIPEAEEITAQGIAKALMQSDKPLLNQMIEAFQQQAKQTSWAGGGQQRQAHDWAGN
jgi:hypothetical protein